MSPMKQHKNQFIIGAFVLTLAGLFSRFAGFFYRIFLSHQLGPEGMGLYQLIFPVYGICMSLCCTSIQTALSRFIASESHKSGTKSSRAYFGCALFLSLSLALTSSVALYFFSDLIALHLLSEVRCVHLLQMMSLAVPICAAHSCIVGYYYGLQKTTVPAISQIVEQTIRMTAVFLIYQIMQSRRLEFQVIHAVYGLVIGEIGSLFYCLCAFGPLWAKSGKLHLSASFHTNIEASAGKPHKYHTNPSPYIHTPQAYMGSLLRLVIPMTANRLCLSLLQSGEAILIPAKLRLSGLTQSDALSLFGTLTGMALPFILFPSTLINSLAVMLLPEVAKAQASGNNKRVQHTSDLSIRLSLVIGILCLGIFRYFGEALGVVVFNNETAGSFITQMSFLCPFLYLSVTLGSIINGLGKTDVTFYHTLCSLAIRLSVVFFVMPKIGITAYFYGLLGSEIVLTALHLRYLCRTTGLRMNLTEAVLKPTFTLLPVCLSGSALQTLLNTKTHLSELTVYLLTGAWFVCSYLGIIALWSEKDTDD
ncbi:MAG: polysaccharide biosynthesis protein [Lachnospiraceae bacterium]|nr:polysaccharide biosynthesis protein [Lachnospiraceae bacterium]